MDKSDIKPGMVYRYNFFDRGVAYYLILSVDRQRGKFRDILIGRTGKNKYTIGKRYIEDIDDFLEEWCLGRRVKIIKQPGKKR